jgi:hypothetical protein
VLEVGVHDGDILGGGGEDAFDAGGGEAAAADAMEEADAGIEEGVGADEVGGTVGGVVVDEDDLPVETTEGFFEAGEDFGDVFALVEGGKDDGKVVGGVVCAGWDAGGVGGAGVGESDTQSGYVHPDNLGT